MQTRICSSRRTRLCLVEAARHTVAAVAGCVCNSLRCRGLLTARGNKLVVGRLAQHDLTAELHGNGMTDDRMGREGLLLELLVMLVVSRKLGRRRV